MAPQRFGEKVTYQSIRKLSENCNLFSSGSEQEFSAQEKRTENRIFLYMNIYSHVLRDGIINLMGVYDSPNTKKVLLQVQTC